MNSNPEYLIDLIYKKLKNYNAKEIFLKKENLKLFISSLFKEDWIFWYIVKIKVNMKYSYV